jgi:hypothetical protein
MAINISFGVSFYTMQNWKGIWEKARKVHGTKAYVTSDETVILPVVFHGHETWLLVVREKINFMHLRTGCWGEYMNIRFRK